REGWRAAEVLEARREEWYQSYGPFLYISVLAVHPDYQGRGLGSQLLAHLCRTADAAGLSAYLESTSEGGNRLYGRYGFELRETWRPRPGAPVTHILVRPPKPATAPPRPPNPPTTIHPRPTRPCNASSCAVAAATAAIADAVGLIRRTHGRRMGRCALVDCAGRSAVYWLVCRRVEAGDPVVAPPSLLHCEPAA
ncbi:hypothetical protein Agub_g13548, partial [Astrephomene gubernaculifera]